jgi:ribosomal-protein-alanine N-acetyltransferase
VVRELRSLLVEPLGSDVVTAMQCVAIDADAFPYPSADLGLAARDEGAWVWVAREAPAARVIGFLFARIVRGALFVVGIAADRAHRRRGVGRALLREAKSAAAAMGVAVVLDVASGNAAAIGLYESEGFRVRRKLPGLYPPSVEGGPDALEMVWDAD